MRKASICVRAAAFLRYDKVQEFKPDQQILYPKLFHKSLLCLLHLSRVVGSNPLKASCDWFFAIEFHGEENTLLSSVY
ncbi:hypothetical protein SAMN05216228_102331 [Rhizobium tibeticum]|uniref:Uncharacterized protein n=1 Tax=Rhizobium tibeticum TaxID=501024 RepID=A0A1H8S2R8_9HYPH|nr:hypothetical protein RTCCBAU85039_4592 [Rhizobium tibeticum]SEO72945.1 hypothetical protein SAMN05216228_102331 [Rhizobium tibeticum]